MRNLLFLMFFTGVFCIGKSQTYKGFVYDWSTNNPLPNAIIYISGTSAGTNSNDTGYFELNVSRYPAMPVTVSLAGYQSYTTKELFLNLQNNVYLIPKSKELSESVVTDQENLNNYLNLFKREFLGESFNSKNCKIRNEDALRITNSVENGTQILSAKSASPIVIENKSLAYTITYYLDKFRCAIKKDYFGNELVETLILGNFIFKDEISGYSMIEQQQIEEKRRQAFLGSRVHFFRLLFKEEPVKTNKNTFILTDSIYHSPGFMIMTEHGRKTEKMVIENDSISKYLISPENLIVKFQNNKSTLDIPTQSVYFQKNGFFDPGDLSFRSGAMATKRIGDLLPFDYKYDAENP